MDGSISTFSFSFLEIVSGFSKTSFEVLAWAVNHQSLYIVAVMLTQLPPLACCDVQQSSFL